jgi:Flp pilus assembly protein TadG
MKRKVRRKGREGQALVEFALVVPVLLLLLLGIVEFGLLLYNQQVITNASREGARFGIVAQMPRRSADSIRIVVANYAQNHLITFGNSWTPDESNILVTHNDGQTFSKDLTVRVSFQYQFLVLPNFLGALAGIQELRAESTMKYE